MLKLLLYITSSVLLLLLLVATAFSINVFDYPPKKTKKFFEEKGIRYTDTMIDACNRKIRVVATGNDTAPMVLFVHGSPGMWSMHKDYLIDSALLQKAYLVAFDRVGYGGSGSEGVKSLEEQFECIRPIIEQRKNKSPIVIVAHSYGGPITVKIATRMSAADVKHIILLAPTIAPDVEEGIGLKRWGQRVVKRKITGWMFGKTWHNSTNEMQPLPDYVRQMEADYKNITIDVTEAHGTKDWLAPFANQDYVKQKLTNAKVKTVVYEGENHFIHVTQLKPNIQLILEAIK